MIANHAVPAGDQSLANTLLALPAGKGYHHVRTNFNLPMMADPAVPAGGQCFAKALLALLCWL